MVKGIYTKFLFALLLAGLVFPASFAHAAAARYAFTITELKSAITQALVNEGAGDALEVNLSNISNPVLHRAQAPIQLAIDFIDYDARSLRWEATISLYSDDKLTKREQLTGRYAALVEVPVAARRIFGGEVITRSDISFEHLPEHRLRSQVIYKVSDLIGKSARRTLREGQPVASHEVEAPIVAKRGDLLQVSYVTPYMEIRTFGEALEDGAIGQRISVRNPDSEAVLRAVVIAPGLAEVQTHLQLSQNHSTR